MNKDIQADRNLKSKAERQRILREKQSTNTKLFLEQRKAAAYKQTKKKEKLQTIHEAQKKELQKHKQLVRQEDLDLSHY